MAAHGTGWSLCPFDSLKTIFPDLPAISTPHALAQYLNAHDGTPLLYPIDDPELATLKGYSLFDDAHHLAYLILPAKTVPAAS